MKDKEGLIIGIGMEPKSMSMNELCVPTSALSVSGDDGDTAPSEGDMVDFPVSGKISHVEGDKTYVTVMKANGQELPNPKEKENSEENNEEKEIDGMRKMAKKEDDEAEMNY
jgi:hypothetical protein